MSIDSRSTPAASRLAALALLVVASGVSAQGLYKIVGPDGRVTYSDRPPAEGDAGKSRWQPVQPGSSATALTSVPLPPALRQASQRYPVVLYTSSSCSPCDAARQFLQARGVPFAERTLVTAADAQVLQQRIGSRTLPSVTIGSQTLAGLDESAWSSYLDAAGYPRTNQLPSGWRPSPASPLTPPQDTAAQDAPDPSAASEPMRPTRSGTGGIRF